MGLHNIVEEGRFLWMIAFDEVSGCDWVWGLVLGSHCSGGRGDRNKGSNKTTLQDRSWKGCGVHPIIPAHPKSFKDGVQSDWERAPDHQLHHGRGMELLHPKYPTWIQIFTFTKRKTLLHLMFSTSFCVLRRRKTICNSTFQYMWAPDTWHAYVVLMKSFMCVAESVSEL